MGLLDDAIREHLDLKRRRGADPADIERAEREALGPVRRGPEPAEEPDLHELPPAEPAYEAPAHEEEFEAAAYLEDHGDNIDWDDAEPEPPPAPLPTKPIAAPTEEHALPSARHEPTPAPPLAAPEVRGGRPPDSGETVEYDVESAMAEESAEAEDVLEETPDFLQDTPDHDRLWFEQRPPRDFDFDG
jgi:hypothetical protein